MAVLVRVEAIEAAGKVQPQETRFDSDSVSIGRNATNSLVLASPDVSGKHAVVMVKGNTLLLSDVGSSNGTFLEDKKLAPNTATPVKSQDRIIIGKFLLRVDLVGDKAAAEKEAVKSKPVPANPSPAKPVATAEVGKSADGSGSRRLNEEELRIKRSIHEQLINRLDLGVAAGAGESQTSKANSR